MYTAIAYTRNIIIEASSLQLDTTSTEKRSYQYNKVLHFIVTNTSTIYTEVTFISSLQYSCLLSEFSDINDSGPSCWNTSHRRYHLSLSSGSNL